MLESLYGLFEGFKKTWRMNYPADPPHWTQVDMPDLTGKVALVTGGSSGIGFEMCKALLIKGAKLYCVGRSGYKGQTALNELAAIGKGDLKFIEIDLASLDTTRTAAQEFLSQETRLDVLINNAGEFLPPIDKLTVDGYDSSFGVNCVATCFFTLCLLPRLLETPGSRIVHMSSDAYRWVQRIDYESVFEGDKRRQMDPALIYGQSKLGIMLFSSELHRRYHRNGIVSVTVHPGFIKSNVWRHKPAWMAYLINLAMYPTHMGAITPLWAATSPEASDMGGREYKTKHAIPWARVGQAESWTDAPEQTKELWNWVISQTEKFNPSIARFKSE